MRPSQGRHGTAIVRLCFQGVTAVGPILRGSMLRKSRLVSFHETAQARLERNLARRSPLLSTPRSIYGSRNGSRSRARSDRPGLRPGPERRVYGLARLKLRPVLNAILPEWPRSGAPIPT